MLKANVNANWDKLQKLADELDVEVSTTDGGIYWVTFPTHQVKFFDRYTEVYEYLLTYSRLIF